MTERHTVTTWRDVFADGFWIAVYLLLLYLAIRRWFQ